MFAFLGKRVSGLLSVLLLVAGCASGAAQQEPATSTPTTAASTPTPTEAPATPEPPAPTSAPAPTEPPAPTSAPAADVVANVTAVEVSGEAGNYRFRVTIASPDTGCDQYADWWEVVGEDGTLHYRRILAHSHVNEQPFTRSGSPVDIAPDTVVWVRAHMQPGGYGGQAFRGTVADGFEQATPPPAFAPALADMPPLPDGCAF